MLTLIPFAAPKAQILIKYFFQILFIFLNQTWTSQYHKAGFKNDPCKQKHNLCFHDHLKKFFQESAKLQL